MDDVTFSIGQVVPWPPAPMGMAQVSELRRSKVQLSYPFKNGRIARPLVNADKLAHLQQNLPLLFRLHNIYNRGIVPREKSFKLPPPVRSAA